jgi:hypothetical protein
MGQVGKKMFDTKNYGLNCLVVVIVVFVAIFDGVDVVAAVYPGGATVLVCVRARVRV